MYALDARSYCMSGLKKINLSMAKFDPDKAYRLVENSNVSYYIDKIVRL